MLSIRYIPFRVLPLMFKWSFFRQAFVVLALLSLNACSTFTNRTISTPVSFITPTPIKTVTVHTPIVLSPTAQPVNYLPLTKKQLSQFVIPGLNEREISCLANAIYFEARGEGSRGQIAVGYVVTNRMKHKKFPDTACDVVYQRNRRGCQFSWVCGSRPIKIHNQKAYEAARGVAIAVLTHSVANPIKDSIYFRHRTSRSRYASRQMLRASIGQHRFFAAR